MRINDASHFAWQAQYSVKLKCHFSWQAQYSVKFGMIAGARNVVTSVARRVADDGFQLGSFSDPARIILGSSSDRPRIGNDVSAVFEKFL